MKTKILHLFILIALTTLPARLLGDPITVTITVDNGYGFGFGDINGIYPGQYYGGVDNCTAGQVLNNNPYLFGSYDGQIPDAGPEIYKINANTSDYIYIVSWSDDGVYQGTVASFVDDLTGVAVTTSANSFWPWEVFATGKNWAINCVMGPGAQHGPPLTGISYAINNQIALANASAGGSGSSAGWVGNNGWAGSTSVAPIGSMVHGRLDFSGQFNGNAYPFSVPSRIGPGALMMEYNPEPTNSSCNPFVWGSISDYSTTPNFLREYLIYRIGPLIVVPGLIATNICTNGCITIYSPNNIIVTTSSNSMPVNYSVSVADSCCGNGSLITANFTGVDQPVCVADNCCTNCVTLVSHPPSGYNFPLGTTTVTSTAFDTLGNSDICTFTVTVCQTNCLLQIHCPSNIVATSCVSTQLFYTPTVTDSCCTNWTVVCDPTNGSYFNPDTTNTVTCHATDSCGNSNSCSFTVTVQCNPLPVVAIETLTNNNLNLNWSVLSPANWKLQESTDLIKGGWITVSTSMPPFVISNKSRPMQFYRLINTNGP